MSTTNTESTNTVNTSKPVYEAPEVTNHVVNQIVQGTGSNIQDGLADPGNLS